MALIEWIARLPRWILTVSFGVLFTWSFLFIPVVYYFLREYFAWRWHRLSAAMLFLMASAICGAFICVLFGGVLVYTMQIRFYMSGVLAGLASVVWCMILISADREKE
jgi:hypothetical protein